MKSQQASLVFRCRPPTHPPTPHTPSGPLFWRVCVVEIMLLSSQIRRETVCEQIHISFQTSTAHFVVLAVYCSRNINSYFHTCKVHQELSLDYAE